MKLIPIRSWADIQANFDTLGRLFGLVRPAGTPNGPVFGANWADYASGWDTLKVIKIGRIVVLQGLIFKNAAVIVGDVMLTMPVDCRPAGNVMFTSFTNGGTARVDIFSDGRVFNQTGAGFGGGAGGVPGGGFYLSVLSCFIAAG